MPDGVSCTPPWRKDEFAKLLTTAVRSDPDHDHTNPRYETTTKRIPTTRQRDATTTYDMSDQTELTLSRTEALILHLLVTRQKTYGLELVDASEGKIKRGTVYVTLARMEDKGYLTSKRESIENAHTIPRRMYKATGLGKRALRNFFDLGAAVRQHAIPA